MDVDFAFVTNPNQGARVRRIMLNRAQCEKTVVCSDEHLRLEAFGRWTRSWSSKTDYSLDNYAFVVTNWQLSADFGAVLNLREENADIYDAPRCRIAGDAADADGAGDEC
jgi:hypothetical protein